MTADISAPQTVSTPSQEARSSGRTIRVGAIGAGYWGPNHIRNLAENPRTELVGICDIAPEAQDRMLSTYPDVFVTPDFDALLERCEAVVVVTPASLHFEHVNRALDAGKHVLVEKPFVTRREDAAQLVRKSTELGLTLVVGHSFLFNQLILDAKQRIESGELGDPLYFYSWRLGLGPVRNDVDTMWNVSVHDIPVSNYLFGARPYRAAARGLHFLRPDSGLCDVAFSQLDYPDGRFAHLHASWFDPQRKRQMVLVGRKKLMVMDFMGKQGQTQIFDNLDPAHLPTQGGTASLRTSEEPPKPFIPNISRGDSLKAELTELLRCIDTGDTPLSNARTGLEVVSVLEALSRSMRENGQPVEIDYPD